MATPKARALQADLHCVNGGLQWRAVEDSLKQWGASGRSYDDFFGDWKRTVFPHAYSSLGQMYSYDHVPDLREKAERFATAVVLALNKRKVDHGEDWVRDILPPPCSKWNKCFAAVIVVFAAATITFAVCFYIPPLASDPPPTAQARICSPLTEEGFNLWQTVSQTFQDHAALIPRLTDDLIAVSASRPSSHDQLRRVAEELRASIARTLSLAVPYLECVQDIGTSARTEDDMVTTPLSVYINHYSSQVHQMRSPAELLYHNLQTQSIRVAALQKALASFDNTNAKEQQSRQKLTNLLIKLDAATDQCVAYMRRIEKPITEGLVAISRSQSVPKTIPSLDGQVSSDHLMSTLERGKLTTAHILRSWEAICLERDRFLFGGDSDQRQLNTVGPLQEGVLVTDAV